MNCNSKLAMDLKHEALVRDALTPHLSETYFCEPLTSWLQPSLNSPSILGASGEKKVSLFQSTRFSKKHPMRDITQLPSISKSALVNTRSASQHSATEWPKPLRLNKPSDGLFHKPSDASWHKLAPVMSKLQIWTTSTKLRLKRQGKKKLPDFCHLS